MSTVFESKRFMVQRKQSEIGETIKTVFYAVLVALAIRTCAYEPFNIPSGSMIPHLLVGDYLFVSKYSYGYSRHSLPFSPPLFEGRVGFNEPERGDIAVFKYPDDTSIDYIKRVIGLPGETIQMRGGRLYINGKRVARKKMQDHVYVDTEGRVARSRRYVETLPGGVKHTLLEIGDTLKHDDTPEYTIPSGYYFMMGDNRDRSRDSRVSDVGFVPAEYLVGRAEVIFFSTNGEARLWEFWKWPMTIRWGRLFKSLRASSGGTFIPDRV